MSGKRLYTLNENIFKNINTQESSYWLGFLFADAYVKTKPQYLCSLKIGEKDKEHLVKFKDFLGTNKPLFYRESQTPYGLAKSYQLDVCGKTIVQDLINKGCINKKSLTLKFPKEQIPKRYLKDFIRGYFDGDGSVFETSHKRKYTYLGISVCGTKEFLSELSTAIFGEVICIYKEKRRSSNTWSFKLSGNKRTKKFLEYIYENASVYLERKKEIVDNYIKNQRT